MNPKIPFKKDDLELLISKELISDRIQTIAKEINFSYQDKDLLILAILKGSICLVADLIRALNSPLQLDFICAKSYGMKGAQRGSLTVSGFEELNLGNKHILIVDDILDSGHTLKGVIKAVEQKKPASIKTLVLLSKTISTKKELNADWELFHIEDRFVVGYGMDYCEEFRELSGIFTLKGV